MKKLFLVTVVIGVAALGLGLPQTASAQIGTGSCVGIDACLGGPNIAGDSSCIGDEACREGPDEVGSNTCVGAQTSCDSAIMTCPGGWVVSKDPNNGCAFCPCPPPGTNPEPCPVFPGPPTAQACYQAGGVGYAVFGDNSCDGYTSCYGSEGSIGGSSCNGGNSCRLHSGIVGDGACNGTSSCADSVGSVGSQSCDGEVSCGSVTGNVGTNACNGGLACRFHSGDVGDDSCNDDFACQNSIGSIGGASCNGTGACSDRSDAVGSGSCNGIDACSGTGSVGSNSCNGDQACEGVTAPIGDCERNTVFVAACPQPAPSLQPLGLSTLAALAVATGLLAIRARSTVAARG